MSLNEGLSSFDKLQFFCVYICSFTFIQVLILLVCQYKKLST